MLRGGARARASAAPARPHRLLHAALHRHRRRVRGCWSRGRSRSWSARENAPACSVDCPLPHCATTGTRGAAAAGRARVPPRRHPARRRRDRRAGDGQPKPMLAHEAAQADEPGLGDEARHHLRRARAARPRLPLDDRGIPRRAARPTAPCTATWCSSATAIPRSPIEQWQAFMATLRRTGARRRSTATSCSTAPISRPYAYDPAAFDGEPLKPYNVGPDALLVNFKSMQLRVRARTRAGDGVDRGPDAAARRTWRSDRRHGSPPATAATGAARSARRSSTAATAPTRSSPGATRASCGERDWWVVAARSPRVRARDVHRLFSRGRRPVRGRREGRPRARRQARRSRCSSRRRSTTSCAT